MSENTDYHENIAYIKEYFEQEIQSLNRMELFVYKTMGTKIFTNYDCISVAQTIYKVKKDMDGIIKSLDNIIEKDIKDKDI